MTESKLRKFHRTAGIVLAFFIFLQGGTGLFITFLEMSENNENSHDVKTGELQKEEESAIIESLEFIHKKGGTWGAVYRIIVGVGLLGMVISGTTIFLKIHARSRK